MAGFGLDLATVAMNSSAAVAADTEQTSTAVGAALALGPGATVVVGPEVVEPTVAPAGLLAELAVPKGVVLGLFVVVASTVADDEAELPMGPGAFAFVGLEADPMLVTSAACSVVETAPMEAELVVALPDGPRLDERGSGAVLAPQGGSMTAGLEGPMHLSALGAVLAPEGTDFVPKEAGMGIDLLLLPEAGLDATNVTTAALAFARVPPPRSSAQRVGSNPWVRCLPESWFPETVLELRVQGESVCADPLWWRSQNPPGGQEVEKAEQQVQGLAPALQ